MSREKRGTLALEAWAKQNLQGYLGVRIRNMTTSWRNGLAFCALIHRYRPDLIDFEKLDPDDIFGNNSLAFDIAESKLGIPALLEAEDMVKYEIPDRLSILTYVAQFYSAFKNITPVSAGSHKLLSTSSSSDSAISSSSSTSSSPSPTTLNPFSAAAAGVDGLGSGLSLSPVSSNITENGQDSSPDSSAATTGAATNGRSSSRTSSTSSCTSNGHSSHYDSAITEEDEAEEASNSPPPTSPEKPGKGDNKNCLDMMGQYKPEIFAK